MVCKITKLKSNKQYSHTIYYEGLKDWFSIAYKFHLTIFCINFKNLEQSKIKKIIKTAVLYLENTDCEMRFDVAEVYFNDGKCEINYIENAFGGSYEIFSD